MLENTLLLYVEDDPADQACMMQALAKQAPNIMLVTAGICSQAKLLLKLFVFDVVIADCMLPDGDGISLISWIRWQGLSSACIILVGEGSENTALAALKAGADDYLIKKSGFCENIAGTIERISARNIKHLLKSLFNVLHCASRPEIGREIVGYMQARAPHICIKTVLIENACLDELRMASYDAILIDHHPAGKSGIQLLKELQIQSAEDACIIILADPGDEDAAVQSIKLGATDYLVRDNNYLSHIPCVIERAIARRRLGKSENRYRNFLNRFQGIAYAGDLDARILFAHGAFEPLTGYSESDFTQGALTLRRLIHPEDFENIEGLTEVASIADFSCERQYRIIRKDGKIRWVKEFIQNICDASGRPRGVEGTLFDITEQKVNEHQLEKSKMMFQAFIDGISEPMVMLDRSYTVKLLNKEATRYFNTNFQNAIGNKCYAFRNQSSPCGHCPMEAAIQSQERICVERNGYFHPDRIERVVVYPLDQTIFPDGGVVIRIRDITESRIMENKIIQSERLASLGLLVSGITHEINNPNNFITFNIPILRDYLEELMPAADQFYDRHPNAELFGMSYSEFKEDLFKLLNNIEHGSTRINATVAQLKEFSRPRARKETWIELKNVVERAAAICRNQIQKMARSFKLILPEDPCMFYTDSGVLEQVVINFLINAAQAADKSNSWIRLVLKRAQNGKVIIKVSDNGCGMDEATRQKIFTPFFTSKKNGVGTGLGLYVSKNLLESIGGRIDVRSIAGKGSCFKIHLYELNPKKTSESP